MERGEFLSRIVRKLLGNLARNRIQMRLLLDREFFKISVINELDARGIPYVMPAVKTPGIEKALAEHVSGLRAAVSKYVLRSVPGGPEAEVNPFILKKGVRAGVPRWTGGTWCSPPTHRARRWPACWWTCRSSTGSGGA